MAAIPYIEGRTPEWRNWQTRWTQNPVRGDSGVGSIPSSGTRLCLHVSGATVFWCLSGLGIDAKPIRLR